MKKHFLSICAACAIGVAMFTQAAAQTGQYHSQNYVNNDSYLSIDGDFTYNPNQFTVKYKDGKNEYDFKMKNDTVSDLYVDGKLIPPANYYLYKDVIVKVKEQIKRDREQAKEDEKQAELDRQQAEEDRKQAVKDQEQAEEDRKQAELDRQEAVKEQEQAKQDQAQAEEDRKQAVRDQEQAEQDRKQALQDQAQAEEDRKQAEEDRKQAEIDRKQAEEDRAMMKALLQEIVTEGLAPSVESVKSFCLTEDGLVINGKQQPDLVFNKFKEKFFAKYLKRGWTISYGTLSGRQGIFMNKDDLKEQ